MPRSHIHINTYTNILSWRTIYIKPKIRKYGHMVCENVIVLMGREDCYLNLEHSWLMEIHTNFKLCKSFSLMHLNLFPNKCILQDSKGDIIWYIWVEIFNFLKFTLSDLMKTSKSKHKNKKILSLRIFVADLFWQLFKLFSCSEFDFNYL